MDVNQGIRYTNITQKPDSTKNTESQNAVITHYAHVVQQDRTYPS